MNIIKIEERPVEETPHLVDVRKLYDKESAQAMHISLNPGEALKPHITPVDVFFFILEGTPIIQVDQEKIQVEVNNLVESPKDFVHCIYNNSESLVRVLVVKAPKPASKAKLL